MQRALLLIGIILTWLLALWGCLVTAFGGADLYMVVSGGVQPGESMWVGKAAPTVGQAAVEVAVGLAMIAAASLCRHLLRKRESRLKNTTGQLTQA